MKKKLEGDIRKWKSNSCSWIGRTNIVKMAIFSKLLYRFSTVPIKIPTAFLTELEKTILKFILNQKRVQIAKAILGNKSKVEEALQS